MINEILCLVQKYHIHVLAILRVRLELATTGAQTEISPLDKDVSKMSKMPRNDP